MHNHKDVKEHHTSVIRKINSMAGKITKSDQMGERFKGQINHGLIYNLKIEMLQCNV